MATINLRDIPEDVYRKIKVAAAMAGVTMKAWIIEACEKELNNEAESA